ncbi:hypothetical protein TcCL_Unassigned00994 [Trypanosoma cruzi]|nr:hypothetical protein TcCL_Unassigned00994 [Trypanosoma cruzi]
MGNAQKRNMSLARVVSVLVARPRNPSSSKTGGFLLRKQTKRVLSIHPLSQNRRPQLFPLNSIIARRRLESSVGFRLMWRGAGEKGTARRVLAASLVIAAGR